jgi:hypothetical protein
MKWLSPRCSLAPDQAVNTKLSVRIWREKSTAMVARAELRDDQMQEKHSRGRRDRRVRIWREKSTAMVVRIGLWSDATKAQPWSPGSSREDWREKSTAMVVRAGLCDNQMHEKHNRGRRDRPAAGARLMARLIRLIHEFARSGLGYGCRVWGLMIIHKRSRSGSGEGPNCRRP